MADTAGSLFLVTGGSTGIGRAVAQALVDQGAEVVITGRRQDALDSAVAELGESVRGVRSDASDPEQLDDLFADLGELQGIFVNAGGGEFAPLESVSAEQIDTAFATNVRGAILTVQKALPHLREGSSVVLTGSTAARGGVQAFGLYSASKAALHALSRTWAVELAPRGIRVNTVVPGPTDTPGLAGLNPDDPQAILDQLATGTLTGRLIETREVAAAVVFLLSDASSAVTGSELFVDAGESARG